MAGPERIEWRRGFPARAWGRLGWYLTMAALAAFARHHVRIADELD